MKIVLIHGDNTDKSYARFSQILAVTQKRSWEILRHNPEMAKLQDTLYSQSLFAANRMIVIEALAKIKKIEWKWLSDTYKNLDGNLLLYHTDLVSATLLKDLPKDITKEEFKLPKLIWTFLDSFYPGNSKVTLKLFHEVIESEAPELVFALLASHLRDLVWITIGEIGPQYPSWRISKLRTHAHRFTSQKLQQILKLMAEIDLKVKTSTTNLSDSLDFLIVSQLE